MLNSEERTKEVFTRVNKLNEKRMKFLKKIVITQGIGLACCMLLLVYAIMLGGADTLVMTEHALEGTSASIFANSPYLLCIVASITSFILGVICTLICVMTQRKWREGVEGECGTDD